MNFKECKVVMLPTNKKARVGQISKCMNYIPDMSGGNLFDADDLIYTTSLSNLLTEFKSQELYFLSDDPIEEGNYYYSESAKQVKVATAKNAKDHYFTLDAGFHSTWKKIIASTNPDLNLPRPSQGFVKKYCEKGEIDKVMVKFDELETIMEKTQFPVTHKNTITIRPLKEESTEQKIINLYEEILFGSKITSGIIDWFDADDFNSMWSKELKEIERLKKHL